MNETNNSQANNQAERSTRKRTRRPFGNKDAANPNANTRTPATPSARPARNNGPRGTTQRPGGGRPNTGPRNRPQGRRPQASSSARTNSGLARSRSRRPQQRRRPDKAPALTHRLGVNEAQTHTKIPDITDEDTVRIITVSGVEEIGRNMNIIETKDDIIVVDAGFQFVSEESNAPGINYILPNTQYLEERKDKIRALVVTHGHLDHIGGIPFIMERIGNPPIYTQYLTSLMILKRQEEFPQMEPVDMHVVKEGETFTVGSTRIKTFPVTHSIPDAMGIGVETKHGDVVVTGDIKLVHEDGEVVVEERSSWEKVGLNNNLALLCDSTNAERAGFSAAETRVFETLEDIIKAATGRLIIGTFASQFDRLINVIKVCEGLGKKVILEGRSMKTNVEIAIKAKLIEVDPKTFIQGNDIKDYPVDKIVVLSTGAQGEEFAALMRMATNKHKFITLNERDTIVLSSSVIPGNEISVQKLRDNISRMNVKITSFQGSHVHASGHGNAGELVWVHKAVKPKFLIPVHGHHAFLKAHMYAAVENGFPKENVIIPDTGTIIDIKNGEEMTRLPMTIPNDQLMVDGFTVGSRQEVVLRDRKSLSEDGMFVVIATVNSKTGKLRKSPDIISRGFVYLRENQQLLSEVRVLVKRTIEQNTSGQHPIDLEIAKEEVMNQLSSFLVQKTSKNPMVIPVLIGI